MEDYLSEDFYTWIHTIVGREKGLSLRDMVVHKSTVDIDTYIDENDKGKFYIGLSRDSFGHIIPWFENIFSHCGDIIDKIINDINLIENGISENG